MASVQPEPGVFDFTNADAIVDFAAENDMTMRGHELIGPGVPDWVATGSWDADSLGQVLRDHITTVVERYRDRNPGVITQWDVVGDAVMPDGSLRPTIWQQVIGDDHIRIAFDAARAADPDASLFYDDFYDDFAVTQDAVASGVALVPGATAERSTCNDVAKCVGVRDRVATLVAEGVPIDGIGFQSHLYSPDPLDFAAFSDWVEELGLVWAVTEFDVPLPSTEIENPESLAFQAVVYADALAACADAPACDTFVTWGISDRFSPIPFESGGVFGGALWLDADDQPKPAFDRLAAVLAERGATTLTTTTSTPPSTSIDASGGPATAPTTPTDEPVEPVENVSSGVDDSDDTNTVFLAVLIGGGSLCLIAAVVVVARRKRDR